MVKVKLNQVRCYLHLTSFFAFRWIHFTNSKQLIFCLVGSKLHTRLNVYCTKLSSCSLYLLLSEASLTMTHKGLISNSLKSITKEQEVEATRYQTVIGETMQQNFSHRMESLNSRIWHEKFERFSMFFFWLTVGANRIKN